MNPSELHVWGDLPCSVGELESAVNAMIRADGQVRSFQVRRIHGWDDTYGFLLPDGRGGGDPVEWVDIFRYTLAIGSVAAFSAFATGFLNRAGGLLAERLFGPASEYQRAARLAAARRRWLVAAEREKIAQESGRDNSCAQAKDAEGCLYVGPEPRLYNADFSIHVYVEEVDAETSIQVSFRGRDVDRARAFDAFPEPFRRLSDDFAVKLVEFLEFVQEREGADFTSSVESKRESARRLAEVLRRQSHADKGEFHPSDDAGEGPDEQDR